MRDNGLIRGNTYGRHDLTIRGNLDRDDCVACVNRSLEARRALGLRLLVEVVPAGEFEKRLSDTYSAAGLALDDLDRLTQLRSDR